MNRLLNGAEKVEDCPPIDVENAKAIMGLAKTVIESKNPIPYIHLFIAYLTFEIDYFYQM